MAYFEYKTNPAYVQGAGSLYEIRRLTHHMGERFFIITMCGPQTERVKEMVSQSFDNPMVSNLKKENAKYNKAAQIAQKYDAEGKKPVYKFADFEGRKVTHETLAEAAAMAKEMNADVVIGIGGGKALDMARGVHHLTGCRVALCPTAAASNAAATTLNVIYNEDGSAVVGAGVMDLHPDLVLADTSLLVEAPYQMLVAGIGDCISAAYETNTSIKEAGNRMSVVDTSYYSNEINKQVFYEHGLNAVKAAKEHKINFSFDCVIAAILHISGPYYDSMMMHFSHILNEALIGFEGPRKMIHGCVVGYGVIPQMHYIGEPEEEFHKYIDFAKSIGLPVTLKEIGMDKVTWEEFKPFGEAAVNSVTAKFTTSKATAEDLYRCMQEADKRVQSYLAGK